MNFRGVEQLAARRAHNPKVAGSSPAPATKISDPPDSSESGGFSIPDPRFGSLAPLASSGGQDWPNKEDLHGKITETDGFYRG